MALSPRPWTLHEAQDLVDDPFLVAAQEALARAEERLSRTATAYGSASPFDAAEVRQAYYDALGERAEAEQRLLHAGMRGLR